MTKDEYGRLLNTVGDFYREGLAIRGWGERMRFLHRGQQWLRPCTNRASPTSPSARST
jgi:hypothetical protein